MRTHLLVDDPSLCCESVVAAAALAAPAAVADDVDKLQVDLHRRRRKRRFVDAEDVEDLRHK